MEGMPVIALAEALKRAMGDADFLKMMLDELHHEIPEIIARLETAIQEGDLASIGQEAHQLKGAAANLGAKAVAGAALKLEQIGESKNPEGSGQALEELKQAAEIFGRHIAAIDWKGLAAKSSAQD